VGSSTPSSKLDARPHVLIADDDPASRHLLRVVLESAAYRVSDVHDGRELYDVLAMSPPGHFSLVIVDQVMPGLRGLSVLAQMSSRTRFAMLTGMSGSAVENAAERLGAVAFMRKPISMIELVRVVRRVTLADERPFGMVRTSDI
jgi:DNA-binding NtrC family response regulator